MKAVWPEVPLSEVLSEVSRPERPAPDHEYRLLGMRWYAGGLFEKERKGALSRRATSIELKKAIWSTIASSPGRGAFGIVGPDVTGAYVSNEFPCFTVNKDFVSPDFLLSPA